MLDTAELSLEEYRFSSKTGNGTGVGKHRHVVDAMRTTAWFHTLRLKTDAKSTYEMERRLEPESFGVDESGTAYRRNKWRGYRLGRHTPRQALVEAMERLHPGTQEVFEHVLWDVLKSGPVLPRHLLLERLRPNVSKIISSPRLVNRDGKLRSDAVMRLVDSGNLDGMAGLVALLREAIASGNAVHQGYLSLALCRTTITSAPYLKGLGVAAPLVDYINSCVFPLVLEAQRYVLDAKAYGRSTKLCACLVSCAEGNANRRFSDREAVRYLLLVQQGYLEEYAAAYLVPRKYMDQTVTDAPVTDRFGRQSVMPTP